MDASRFNIFLYDYYIPSTCKNCGGVMVYQGVGEYRCEDCGALELDDYGKVRNYIEQHPGANAADIESNIGVSQRTIHKLLRESRIEVAEGSKSFLHCEVCGTNIRSGRFCPECEIKVHRHLEEQRREALRKDTKGYGHGEAVDSGQRRFMREGR